MAIVDLDADKLQENALTSIRLGIEDFQRSQTALDAGGDPARALSAVRNLFAGVLLLFKYKIAISVDEPSDAASLIFNPPEILPYSDGDGGIEWKPDGNFKKTTIDVATIQRRFKGFNIDVDWKTINKLQDCRNHLEHLHPANTLGEVAGFVAELFPVLRDFVQTQLNKQPADLLGAAWTTMLESHNFFVKISAECAAAWATADVPEEMQQWLNLCRCEECGSSLLSPHPEDLEEGNGVDRQDDIFKYQCMACSHVDLIAPLMIETLNDAYDYDPRDGGEPGVESCHECDRGTFIIHEQKCSWCDATLDYSQCKVCEEPLSQDDQMNGGLCGYHLHIYEKVMQDD